MKAMKNVARSVAESLIALADQIKGMEKRLRKLETQARKQVAARNRGKVSRRGAPGTKGKRKGSATDAVYTIIGKSRKGVGTDLLKTKTGFSAVKIFNIISRLKREGKIKSVRRGAYIKV